MRGKNWGLECRLCCDLLILDIGDLKLQVNLFSIKNENTIIQIEIPQFQGKSGQIEGDIWIDHHLRYSSSTPGATWSSLLFDNRRNGDEENPEIIIFVDLIVLSTRDQKAERDIFQFVLFQCSSPVTLDFVVFI